MTVEGTVADVRDAQLLYALAAIDVVAVGRGLPQVWTDTFNSCVNKITTTSTKFDHKDSKISRMK